MLNVGDLIIYPAHGICKVDDIADKTYGKVTRTYYVLRPIENNGDLTIHAPVNNKNTELFRLINKEEAKEVISIFNSDKIDWIEKPQARMKNFADAVKSGDRVAIAKVANTIMRKRIEVEAAGKKIYENDKQQLINIQNTLFKELALALETSTEAIHKKVNHIIEKNHSKIS